jgi:hypothetical protein
MQPHGTSFNKHAQRYAGKSRNWAVVIPVIIGVCILFAIISVIAGSGSRIYMPGALIVIPLMYLFQKEKYDHITFMVRNEANNNFTFTIINPDNQRIERTIDEYSYWYAVDPQKSHGGQYESYFEIKSGQEAYYFKGEMNLIHPPKGWPESDVRLKHERGLILMNGLEELAFKIDQGAST